LESRFLAFGPVAELASTLWQTWRSATTKVVADLQVCQVANAKSSMHEISDFVPNQILFLADLEVCHHGIRSPISIFALSCEVY
jgi:hypothetical protein